MKSRLIFNILVVVGITSNLHAIRANCEKIPEGTALQKAIKSKKYQLAQVRMKTFLTAVKNYREHCDNSRGVFEQTQISILTYKDELADLNRKKSTVTADCSKKPNSSQLKNALNTGNDQQIETSYKAYKSASKNYLEYCTEDKDYADIYEETLLYDDYYDERKKGSTRSHF